MTIEGGWYFLRIQYTSITPLWLLKSRFNIIMYRKKACHYLAGDMGGRGCIRLVTIGDKGLEGGSKIANSAVTSFLNGPLDVGQLADRSGKVWTSLVPCIFGLVHKFYPSYGPIQILRNAKIRHSLPPPPPL